LFHGYLELAALGLLLAERRSVADQTSEPEALAA
jgi:hypothetical protein